MPGCVRVGCVCVGCVCVCASLCVTYTYVQICLCTLPKIVLFSVLTLVANGIKQIHLHNSAERFLIPSDTLSFSFSFCLLEKARPTPQTVTASPDNSAIRYVTRLFQKAERGDHDAVALAVARHTGGGGGTANGLADVVVEVTPSLKLHSRLEYWKAWGYVDHKPCFSQNFTAQPMQEFLVQVSARAPSSSVFSFIFTTDCSFAVISTR